ncbi:serine carboxypeptidase-like 40 [Neltuma alba]|uniref:serine carboxypeptidase-like 40 n=1 Tax=Neltuma alba TaxID=207710 RepID=UPI0010A527B9|nr:serine carboxypeptidase-like 40 [Prosopis alba]
MFFKQSHHHRRRLLLLLVLSVSVASGFHGNQQAKTQDRFQKLKYLRGQNDNNISGIDKSLFEAEDIDFEVHVNKDQKGFKEKDRIQKLPGQPPARFSQYGGYVTVNEEAGRAFYYYFTEAFRNKQNLPLVLWLNGGPGCSSLAYGAMQELGPFRVNSDGKTLFKNRYSWNHAANVLFLESPAGVGFSYSNKTSDYENNGDQRTASDNYIFLLNWLERFPEYKNRDFYITGESYAGHYVPQLAQTILQHNIKANNTIINLKGIMIGNAAINDETDDKGMYDFLGSHAIMSDSTVSTIDKFCDFSANAQNQPKQCNEALEEVDRDSYYIDIYNIYAPICNNPNLTATPNPTSIVLDACNEYYVIAYMNKEEVQEALHANVTKVKYEWAPCSDVISGWHDSPSSTLPILRQLMDHGIRVWIFSGDTDGRVPVTSTQYSLNSMNMKVNTPWHPWYFNGQVGGYTQVYKGDLTFATVRNAGHQVPSYQAARSLSLFRHFLDGTPLPDTTRY